MDTIPALTLNGIVQFIGQEVARHLSETGQPMDGATLANRIRQTYPTFSYAQVGIERLGEAVKEAEQQGLVCRDRHVKHMALLPGPSLPGDGTPASSRGGFQASRYVRPDIWRAVVLLPGTHDTFYDRDTGRLVGPQESHGNQDAVSRRFVKLEPIPSKVQQGWVKEHFGDTGGPPDSVLADKRWWAGFASWLKEQDRDVLIKWNRFRAQRVSGYLTDWAQRHDVPPGALFERSASRVVRAASQEERRERGALAREAVVQAIGEMTPDELGELRIPLKYLLKHLRAK